VTIDVEIRAVSATVRDLPISQQQPSATETIRRIWPLFAVGLGLLATVAWMALLGWVLYRAVLMLLA